MVESIRTRAFLARRGARIGLLILAILGTLSAWAPFLANDRPYYLVASDSGAFERARQEIVPLAESLARVVREAGGAEEASARLAVEREADALESRVAVLESYMGVEPLGELRGALAASRGPRAPAADALVAAARAAREAAANWPVSARPERSFPLIASLRAIDMLVALLPLSGLAAWALRRRLGSQRALLVALAPAIALSTVVALLGTTPAFAAPGALKSAVARGTLQVEIAVVPPIPFGFAETNLAEAWRPPTWLASSRVDAVGRRVASSSGPPAQRIEARFGEPAVDARTRHVLGTDALGRDVAARVLWGGRISLGVGLAAALLLTVLGTLLGAAAGFCGGFVDGFVSRTIEIVLCFPAFFLVLCAVAWTDPDVVPVPFAIVIVIAAVGWTNTARLVRAEALRVAAADHVMAARALGLHPLVVLVRHVLPNSVGPALIAFGFAAGGAIGVESSLAFLGLGAQIPIPSWGGLVGEARGAEQAWAWIAPGLLVFLAVLAWVLVAEAAREALDPRTAGDLSP